MGDAITIWMDESTEINLHGRVYNLIGYLITNSDKEEYEFLNNLKQARKHATPCWTTMHGSDIDPRDKRSIGLLNRWLDLFKKDNSTYFHVFLYRKNESYARRQTYEHYFAKQSVFSLANKMRKRNGLVVNSMFKDVSTLTVFFDRRRSHVADIIPRDSRGVRIDRFNDLENVYKEQIANQILRISGKDSTTNNFTVRFSFLDSECFDAMQLSDCLLYLIRKKLEQGENGKENEFTNLFDNFFLSDLDPRVQNLGFKEIYKFSEKLNFFESTA